MREGWKEVNFGDVVQFPPKISMKKGTIYPFIPMEALDSGKKYVKPKEEKALTSGGAKFEEGDTLFARITPCLQNGKISQAKNLNGKPGFGSTEYFIFRGKEGVTDTDFIYYLTLNKWFKDKAIGSMVGASGRQRADTTFVRNIEIQLPPLQTQRKIASILSGYDDLIENNLKRIKLLEEKAQLTYEEWFVKMRFPGCETALFDEVTGLPEGWKEKELGEMVSLQQGFALNKKSDHHISIEKTKFPLLKIGDLFNETESLFVKNTIPKQFLVDKNEIIYSRTGQVGHAFMGRKGVIYNNCFRVTANERIERIMLYYFLISPNIVETAKSLATGAAQPDLNHGAFKSIKINLAPLDIQKMFSVPMEQNLEMIYNLKKQNCLLKEARDILLPRLMSGMIDVEELQIETLQTAE